MSKDPLPAIERILFTEAQIAQRIQEVAAEISERNGNYLVAHPGATASDVLQLMEQVKKRVHDVCGVALERELTVW